MDVGVPDEEIAGGLPRTECIARTRSIEETGERLRRSVIDETAAGQAAPVPPAATPLPGDLVGRSAAMLEIFSRIRRVASVDLNVCIYGKSDTGKELIARGHPRSQRASGSPVRAAGLRGHCRGGVELEG